MLDNPFREKLTTISDPLIAVYRFLRLTPNKITVAGLVIACAAAYATSLRHPYWALSLWWFSRLLDGTDGIYARSTNQTSDFGAYLDIVCDMAAYSVMILGFSIPYPHLQMAWSTILILYVLCITSALSLGSLTEKRGFVSTDNRGLRLGAGLAEGGETGVAYTFFLLMPQHIETLTTAWLIILGVTVAARTMLANRLFYKQ